MCGWWEDIANINAFYSIYASPYQEIFDISISDVISSVSECFEFDYFNSVVFMWDFSGL